MGDRPADGGGPSLGWWGTILEMVGNHPGMVDGSPLEGWLPYFGWWVAMLGILGDQPWHLSPWLKFVI